ncbi:hypothetical protein ACIBHX_01830 [Nonomuraea sp. NPDC050536]|uniref:hypothetical protein n=1 Tax=Nonomuraea sp. NPDC050536 TaxID=3364366 RepID=UPI0037CACEDF
MTDDLRQRYAEALAAKFTGPSPWFVRGRYAGDTDLSPADRVDKTMTIRFIAGDGEPALRMPTCNEAAEVCAAVRDEELQAWRERAEKAESALDRLREAAEALRAELGPPSPERDARPDGDRIAAAEWVMERLMVTLNGPACPAPECGHRGGSHSTSCTLACSDCGDVDGAHEDGCWKACPSCERGRWDSRSEHRGRISVEYDCGHTANRWADKASGEAGRGRP